MLEIPALSKITNELKQNLQKELKKFSKESWGSVFRVNRSRIRDIAIYLDEKDARLLNIAINDLGDKFELIYEYFIKHIKEKKKFIFIITEVDKKANEIDSVEIVYPHALKIEREIEKRYGLKFLLFTEEISKELFVVPTSLISPDYNLNILNTGVFNKIHLDNNYFLLQIDRSDTILSVAENTGWTYRGITELIKKKHALKDNLRLTSRICAPSSYHHNIAYIMALEKLGNIRVTRKVELIRTLLCEIERFENSIIYFANLLYLLGHRRKYYNLIKQLELLRDLYRKHFSVRFLDEMNQIGSCKNIDNEELVYLHDAAKNYLPIVFGNVYYFLYKPYVKKSCKGIGVLTRENALNAGVTGHCLRASGIDYDIRYEQPYLSYLDPEISKVWDVATANDGDVFSRLEVKVFDMKSSYMIIDRVLELLKEDKIPIKSVDPSRIKLPGDKIAISQVESPSGGELLYYLRTADRPNMTNLGGAYICTPSLNNFLALKDYILKENNVNNLPLIVHSMDLNFNDIDL